MKRIFLIWRKNSKTDLSEERIAAVTGAGAYFSGRRNRRIYIQPFDGYECREIMAESEGENISVTLGENQKYEFLCPKGQVLLQAEFEKGS